MKRLCLLIGFLFFSLSSPYAQFSQRTLTRLMRQTDIAFQRSLATKITTQPLTRSLLLLQEKQPVLGSMSVLIQASGFVIEDTHNDKKQLWGVTASHYRLTKPQLIHLSTRRRLHTEIYAQGGGGVNDIALFPIPASLKDKVIPLKLAEHGPQLGQEVHSIAFFNDEIHHETNRIVQEVAPHRVLTSLQVGNCAERIGACGAPILNERNEVVGVHVSSSEKHQTGGVVPVEHIRDLLTAFHQKTSEQQPIKFNGVEIERLGINEFISEILVYNKTHLLHHVPLLHHNKVVDYEHLENLIDTTHATEVVFILQHQPLLPHTQGYNPHAVVVSYNLQTGEIHEQQNDNFVPL